MDKVKTGTTLETNELIRVKKPMDNEWFRSGVAHGIQAGVLLVVIVCCSIVLGVISLCSMPGSPLVITMSFEASWLLKLSTVGFVVIAFTLWIYMFKNPATDSL